MKQLQTTRPASANSRAPITIQHALNSTTDSILIKEVETTVVKRERTYLVIRPVCTHCGHTKEHVIGAWFECSNPECPTHDPDTGSAIPLPGEGVIDIDPIKEAA